jgi:predicted O-methyltransferase YrrM
MRDAFGLWRRGLSRFDRIETHLTRREKIKLFDLATTCSGNVVEIGSFVGASTCFLASAILAKGNRNSQRIWCVDTWMNDAMSEGARETYVEFTRNVVEFRDFITPVRSLSLTAAAAFSSRIDLLFIDGDHSHQAVVADWESWSRHLSDGAVVVMHDSGWADGVQRVIAEHISPHAISEWRLPNMYWAEILRTW